MFHKMTRFIVFLCQIIFVFIRQYCIYLILNDYDLFIENVTTQLAQINILYVKIFQAIALNNDLIDERINEHLLKFTDNAPWSSTDIELGNIIDVVDKYNLYLSYGYDAPINSGMISLVFKAYKKPDFTEPVIIKIKRKNIEKKLDEAIDNLLTTMYFLSFIPIIKKYQISELVHKNIQLIRHQTNFIEEIDNMDLFRENCRHLKYIKIPKAEREVTLQYPNIILMEYINGVKVEDVKKDDYEGFAKQVVKFGLVTTLIHGVTHGDLHCGNILFMKDNMDDKYPYKLGIIDFGIVYKVQNQDKDVLFGVIHDMYNIPPRETADKFLNSFLVYPRGVLKTLPKDDYEHIIDMAGEIVKDTLYESKKANQIQIYQFLSKFNNYLNKDEFKNIGIRPSDEFVKLQMILAMGHGVTFRLCGENFIPLVDTVVNELFHTDILF